MISPSSPLQGTLGYLLVSEILVVLGLSWLLIGMMLRRVRYGTKEVLSATDSPKEPLKIEDQPEYQALVEKNRLLELKVAEQLNQAPQVPEDYEKLKSTIQFLEKKLLEYEIVQEEISTLGDLKVENEKLRTELQTLKSQTLELKTETLIKEEFSEFSTKTSEKPQEKDLQNLLSEIESLAEEKSPQTEKKVD